MWWLLGRALTSDASLEPGAVAAPRTRQLMQYGWQVLEGELEAGGEFPAISAMVRALLAFDSRHPLHGKNAGQSCSSRLVRDLASARALTSRAINAAGVTMPGRFAVQADSPRWRQPAALRGWMSSSAAPSLSFSTSRS
jgi:hypothetical protein